MPFTKNLLIEILHKHSIIIKATNNIETLLYKVQNLFELNQFSTNVFLGFQDPLQNVTLHLAVMYPALVFSGFHNEILQTKCLKEQKFISHLYGKPKMEVLISRYQVWAFYLSCR